MRVQALKPIISYRCTNTTCGRVWESNFAHCQKCGYPTEIIKQDGEALKDTRPTTYANQMNPTQAYP